MVKAAKSYQQKYEKIMGESSEDELWSDIERDIAEFKKKVEFGKADGYFWNMYFNLLRSNRLMFAGINKAFITGDMAYMLNGIYQENRFNCIYGNRANSGGAQLISLNLCLLIPVMITSCWKESCRLRQGLLVPVIQLRIIIWFMP